MQFAAVEFNISDYLYSLLAPHNTILSKTSGYEVVKKQYSNEKPQLRLKYLSSIEKNEEDSADVYRNTRHNSDTGAVFDITNEDLFKKQAALIILAIEEALPKTTSTVEKGRLRSTMAILQSTVNAIEQDFDAAEGQNFANHFQARDVIKKFFKQNLPYVTFYDEFTGLRYIAYFSGCYAFPAVSTSDYYCPPGLTITFQSSGVAGERSISRTYYFNGTEKKKTSQKALNPADADLRQAAGVKAKKSRMAKVDYSICISHMSLTSMMADMGLLAIDSGETLKRFIGYTQQALEIQKEVGTLYVADTGTPCYMCKVSNSSWWERVSRDTYIREGARLSPDMVTQTEEATAGLTNEYIDNHLRISHVGEETEIIDTDGQESRPELHRTMDIPRPLIQMFDFKRGTYFYIDVRHLKQYQFDKSLIKQLRIPPSYKNLVRALTSGKTNGTDGRDIIAGKGIGTSILLSGVAGVGKTLLGEVLAERIERPLYMIQCAQLGQDVNEIEKNLAATITRAFRLGAILQLDEADVYIRARGLDMRHNAIVGAFLRVLEYSKGIIILTTNLADSIDDAIESRCIVHMRFNRPKVQYRKGVWETQTKLWDYDLTEEELQHLAEWSKGYSGRDIKSSARLMHIVLTGGFESQFTKFADKKLFEYAKMFTPCLTQGKKAMNIAEDQAQENKNNTLVGKAKALLGNNDKVFDFNNFDEEDDAEEQD